VYSNIYYIDKGIENIMTFIKISQLPSATGVTNDDFMLIVDEPSGVPVTRKITVENLIDSAITDVDGGSIS
jgi:hypothetical protein